MQTEDTLYLVTRLLIYTGLLGIGVAAGSKVGLNVLGTVCAAHGTSGAVVVNGEATVCTRAGMRLVAIINTGAYAGAGALLLGGVIDSYQEEVAAWIQ